MALLFILFFFAPLVALGTLLCTVRALQVLIGSTPSPRETLGLHILPLILCTSALLLTIVESIDGIDWLHMFWTAQIPMVGLFLCSGAMLCDSWRGDRIPTGRPSGAARGSVGGHRWIPRGARAYLSMTALLGVAPVLLLSLAPDGSRAIGSSGAPFPHLWELILWGFGGPLPECLIPTTPAEIARGVGHLHRSLTVTVGTTLIAAWLWLAFCVVACAGRILRHQRLRLAFYLLAPVGLGLLALTAGSEPVAWIWEGFDVRLFFPNDSRQGGIWKCDPVVVRSYGPVLLAALLGALFLALAQTVLPRKSAGDIDRQRLSNSAAGSTGQDRP